MDVAVSNADRTARRVGVVLWSLGMLLGGALLFLLLSRLIFGARPLQDIIGPVSAGAALAFPACFFYLWVPIIFDRYAPEPWWCLAMAFLWGAIPACGFSGWLNTIALGIVTGGSPPSSALVGATMIAPLVEESFKAMAVLGMFAFLHHEFDGVVDGVVYATFGALGFATVENVIYYAQAFQKEGWEGLSTLFVLRGVLGPWGHPLYTSMTGIGLGIARETSKPWWKLLAPLGGFCAAVALHAAWNSMADYLGSERLSEQGFMVAFPALLSVWFLFLFAFVLIVVVLVRRERKNIFDHLLPEVALGTLSHDELQQVCSPTGRIRALFRRRDPRTKALIDAASRLGLARWHASRSRGAGPAEDVDLTPLRQALVVARGGSVTPG